MPVAAVYREAVPLQTALGGGASGPRMVHTGDRAESYSGRTSLKSESTTHSSVPDGIIPRAANVPGRVGGAFRALRGHNGRSAPILTGPSFGGLLPVRGLCVGL